jgi:uncharacterized protein (DUF1330 family)
MPAYVVAELEINDPASFDEYRKGVPATIAAYGGRYVARGGAIQPLEGGWEPTRMVIVEFPNLAQAQAWYASPEYRALREIRQRSTSTRAVLVEGL